jgi:hypothetical protein
MKVIESTTLKHEQPTFHFLLASVFRWHASEDLHEAMKYMDKLKATYWVWYVPCDKSEHYSIHWYQPQVPGSFVLANVEFDERGRIVKPKKEEATA